MKKLLLSSIVLLIFACSIIIFQMSCKKDAQAETGAITPTQIGKVIYGRSVTDPVTGYSYFEIWTANYDGTSSAKVNVTLPTGAHVAESPRISPDGKTIFFSSENYTTISGPHEFRIYSCNIDGTAVKQVASDIKYLSVGAAY